MNENSWTSWYESVQEKWRLVKIQRETDAIKKKMASQERMYELELIVTRGSESKKLLESEFWNNNLEPFLKSEAVLKPWIPKDDQPSPSEHAFNRYLVGSGQVKVLSNLIDRLHRWVDEGIEAENILNSEYEKRKQLSKKVS